MQITLERVHTIDFLNSCDIAYMELTQAQYDKIAKYLPHQRGNVSMSNLQLVNEILYVTENGCKWMALPKSYGNWHA